MRQTASYLYADPTGQELESKWDSWSHAVCLGREMDPLAMGIHCIASVDSIHALSSGYE